MMGVLRACEFDWKGAEREFRRALELDPKSRMSGRYDYYYLVPMRRLDEAVAASRRALELDPLSPFLQWRLGYRLLPEAGVGSRHRPVPQCARAGPAILRPTCFSVLLRPQGKLDEAIRAMETQAQLTGRSSCLGILRLCLRFARPEQRSAERFSGNCRISLRRHTCLPRVSWSFIVALERSKSLRLAREGGRRARRPDPPCPVDPVLRSVALPPALSGPAAENEPGALTTRSHSPGDGSPG